jgi:hypothetical protein
MRLLRRKLAFSDVVLCELLNVYGLVEGTQCPYLQIQAVGDYLLVDMRSHPIRLYTVAIWLWDTQTWQILRLSRTTKIECCSQRTWSVDFTLSRLYPVYFFPPSSCTISFNVIVHRRLDRPTGLIPLDSLTKPFNVFLISATRAACPTTIILELFFLIFCQVPVPVAARSKSRVFGRRLARISGSNTAVGMHVCLVKVLCVVW